MSTCKSGVMCNHGHVIAIATEGNTQIESLAKHAFFVTDCHELPAPHQHAIPSMARSGCQPTVVGLKW